ncbi:MAG: MATE family efflux transporter [Eubacteriales bacterium]|nr:MATE family efflux transporter [Eubacteriales bacterium]
MSTITKKLTSRLYDSSKIDWQNLSFSNRDIKNLLVPLVIQQLLTSLMGMIDTMMVSRVGSAAISAVSLTDSINVLVIQVFAALAAGGTIICSQYIGFQDHKKANEAARQLFFSIFIISFSIGAVCILLRQPLLHLVFGQVEPKVMNYSSVYFALTAASFPFIALFEAGGSFYRAAGNSRFPMIVSVIANLVNIVGNAIFIFVFHWGVMGAALATLLSRALNAVILLVCLRKPKQVIVVKDYLTIRPDFKMILRILAIGVPSGIENGMFQFGKLAIQSSVSTLGTTAIAANAMTIILENLNGIAGIGIGIGLMTVVGQCIGAGKEEEAKYYVVKLTGIAEIAVTTSCLIVFAAAKPVMVLAGMEPKAAEMCWAMIVFVTLTKPFVWTLSFVPVYGMRAAGDVRFSMITSSLTMWLCRVVIAVCLIRFFGFGPIAVWIGMASDWAVRAVIFTIRFRSGRWLRHKVIG